MTVGVHPFPSRTRQLSPLVPTILGWKRPGTIGRRQHKRKRSSTLDGLFSCFWWMGTGYTLLLRCPEWPISLSLGPFRPRRQTLLAVSATGSARRLCSSRTRQQGCREPSGLVLESRISVHPSLKCSPIPPGIGCAFASVDQKSVLL